MILIDSQPKTKSTVLGELSETFVVNNAILKQIIIKPATTSTTYDFSVVDIDGLSYYTETNCSGEYNELIEVPVYGNIIVNITNSSKDEAYLIKLIFRRS